LVAKHVALRAFVAKNAPQHDNIQNRVISATDRLSPFASLSVKSGHSKNLADLESGHYTCRPKDPPPRQVATKTRRD
jgi:hypothetical protein